MIKILKTSTKWNDFNVVRILNYNSSMNEEDIFAR